MDWYLFKSERVLNSNTNYYDNTSCLEGPTLIAGPEGMGPDASKAKPEVRPAPCPRVLFFWPRLAKQTGACTISLPLFIYLFVYLFICLFSS